MLIYDEINKRINKIYSATMTTFVKILFYDKMVKGHFSEKNERFRNKKKYIKASYELV